MTRGDRFIRRPLAERMAEKTDTSGGADACHPWLGAKTNNGYGRIYTAAKRGQTVAHKAAWEAANGQVPAGMELRHTCKQMRHCVNLKHIVLGTHLENMRDRDRDGTTFGGERHHSARLTEQDVDTIRACYATGAFSYQSLADAFGITQQSTIALVKRHTWKRVPQREIGFTMNTDYMAGAR